MPERCERCDPSFVCFDGRAACSKAPPDYSEDEIRDAAYEEGYAKGYRDAEGVGKWATEKAWFYGEEKGYQIGRADWENR